jgi:predicted nucleic acid-binding protein
MLAIDTNVVVRVLTGDHPDQSGRARAVVEREAIFVSTTVLLETEWVLRSLYGFPAAAVADALRRFAGLTNVTLDDPPLIARSLDWAMGGMDFADALHLAGAGHCEAFISFDRALVTDTRRVGAPEVRAP